MDLLRPVVAHVTWDAYLRRDGYDVRPIRPLLAASQYFGQERLRELQLKKLQSLLAFAMRANRFYRERFESCGFEPGDLQRLEDLRLLPVLTKDDIRGSLGQMLSDGFQEKGTIRKRTGGSTGVPVRVSIDYGAASWKKAATERHDGWAGLVPGERLAAVWGDTSGPVPWRLRVRNALTARTMYLDTLRFDDESIERFLREIRRRRPRILIGHAHSVYQLALFAQNEGNDDVTFESVITTAMGISEEERRTIEDVFRTRVYDRYGCEELSIIASQCGHSRGLHVFSEGLILETVEQTPERVGKLIVTDLLNHAMPLIRYEIGDYAVLGKRACPCGRGLPLLDKVVGRTADFLYRTDGVPVFGISILDTFAIHIPGVKQVQVRQDVIDRLDFFVVRDAAFADASLQLLRAQIDQVFGRDMTHTVTFVDKIEQTALGKYRFSICNLGRGDIERAKTSVARC